jgi:hypothetical protein
VVDVVVVWIGIAVGIRERKWAGGLRSLGFEEGNLSQPGL